MVERSQTAIFSKLVKDFMRTVPLQVQTGTPIDRAVGIMADQKASSVMVVDAQNRPLGILTEQDVTRRVAFLVAPDVAVDDVMTMPLMTIPETEYLYHAIARMRRRGLRHMPAVDRQGRLVGMLDLSDALAVAAERLMGQIDRLTHQGNLDGLREVKAAQVELVDELFSDNLPIPEIQALLTHINNDIYRRIVDACVADMEEEGWGAPPVEFCTIVMGSGGRGENYLFPDQDNGFILEDYPDQDHGRVDAYFIELGERACRDLDHIGFPFCRGYVMAVNPLWRKTVSQWVEQIKLWGRKKDFAAIRLADIFFDFQPVQGRFDLAVPVRQAVTKMAKANPFFLQQVYQEESGHNVALGLFGRLITESDHEAYKGQLNLKYSGTLPMVEAVRLMALREGVEETSTVARIEALQRLKALDPNESERLLTAFSSISRLLLRQQVLDFQAGKPVSNFVAPEGLSKREKNVLIDCLKAIDSLRKRVRSDFTGDVFS